MRVDDLTEIQELESVLLEMEERLSTEREARDRLFNNLIVPLFHRFTFEPIFKVCSPKTPLDECVFLDKETNPLLGIILQEQQFEDSQYQVKELYILQNMKSAIFIKKFTMLENGESDAFERSFVSSESNDLDDFDLEAVVCTLQSMFKNEINKVQNQLGKVEKQNSDMRVFRYGYDTALYPDI